MALLDLSDAPDTTNFDRFPTLMALESISLSSNGVLDIFSSLIPKASELISSYATPLRDFVSPNKQQTEERLLASDYKKSVKAVSALPFMTYQDVLVMVPEGFKGHLLDYLKTLAKLHSDLINRTSILLADYTGELNIFLNNMDARKSLVSHQAFYKKVTKEREEITEALAHYFKTGDTRTRAKLGDVVARFSDFENLFREAELLEASATTRKEMQRLLIQVDEASGLLKLLNEKLLSKEFSNISADVAKNISQGAYEAAKYLEIVSLVSFNVDVAVSCCKSIAKQFDGSI